MNNLKKVKYVVNLLPDMAYCLISDRDEMISTFKHKAIQDLLDEYPKLTYFEATFDLQKMNKAELSESIEYFKTISGRYLYEGNFVSREYLEQELSQIDSRIVMTAAIKESENVSSN